MDATGLYYFGARYYDPETGRFITEDLAHGTPFYPQTQNRYVYCCNNPHKYIDTDGKNPSFAIGPPNPIILAEILRQLGIQGVVITLGIIMESKSLFAGASEAYEYGKNNDWDIAGMITWFDIGRDADIMSRGAEIYGVKTAAYNFNKRVLEQEAAVLGRPGVIYPASYTLEEALIDTGFSNLPGFDSDKGIGHAIADEAVRRRYSKVKELYYLWRGIAARRRPLPTPPSYTEYETRRQRDARGHKQPSAFDLWENGGRLKT